MRSRRSLLRLVAWFSPLPLSVGTLLACSGGSPADVGLDSGGGTVGVGGNGSPNGSGGNSAGVGGGNSGSGGAISPAGPRTATLPTPLELLPAPGLVGPALKIDLDIDGRSTNEVTEPGYVAWPVISGSAISQVMEDVTFTFTKTGSSGTELAGIWQKSAVQTPNYARLVGDGLTVTDGAAGSQIKLTLKGLPAGAHSLLTWHNMPGADSTAKVTISGEGVTGVAGLQQGSQVLSNAAAPSAYVTFNAQAGQDVVLSFQSTGSLVINGFELDTPNVAAQASDPTPQDGDEHVETEDGALTLGWKAAASAASHDVYVGLDPNVVQSATHDSPEFQKNQSAVSYDLSGLNSTDRYYWRIDEIDSAGKATRGNVWYFRRAQLAFPGAEGYGRFAVGGRGGTVVHVTNLNDAGAGSFRDAIETDRGPRTIVFDVGGIIALKSRLTLNQSYVTVAGQTAPGKGITLRAAPFGLSGVHDDSVRHVRVRVGHGTTYDGMGMAGANWSIVDHSSISWTIDEGFSSRNGRNITLQRTLISECLNVAGHQNYPAGTEHGYAATIGGDTGSFHHNLLAHCEGRNWSMAGGVDGDGLYWGHLDIFNNVVYNWGHRSTDGGEHEANFVGNYYKPGPSTTIFVALNAQYEGYGQGTQRYYFSGNVMPGRFDESNQDKGHSVQGDPGGYEPWVSEPFFQSYAKVQSAGDAYKDVLSDVGNAQPLLDDHDIRVVKETRDGTTTYKGSVSGKLGLPDSETDVGGYESYPDSARGADWDSDADGLPGWWETAAGTNPNSASGDFSEANTDFEGDGYTALDEYLAFTGAPHFVTTPGVNVSLDLAKFFVAFTKNPSYSSSGAEGGTVGISGTTATFTPTGCGLGRFTVQVKDSEGAAMEREVLVFVDAGGPCP